MLGLFGTSNINMCSGALHRLPKNYTLHLTNAILGLSLAFSGAMQSSIFSHFVLCIAVFTNMNVLCLDDFERMKGVWEF